ncbi:MAG: type VI secretion system baseplate subunit TssG [Candidatus Tectimicrobiota bacterium]
MATHGWGTEHSVATALFTEGQRFDFYQAVRLLELLQPDSAAVGAGTEPEKEAVRFSSSPSLAFPATAITAIQAPESTAQPATMTVNFLGLAGCLGPLPAHYTERLLERSWRQDTAFRDFLDIFNHRLVSLLYRAYKKHYFDHDLASPERGALAQYLFALLGLGTRGLRGRLLVHDRTLLFYAGLLTQQCRSLRGLESLLADYVGVPVRGQQYCGQWYVLEADQLTHIGVSGQNQRLGEGVVLGRRVWDQQGQFRLTLGPLTLQQFLDLLPIGQHFDALCELTRLYVGETLTFTFRLCLRAAEVPATRLGHAGGARLGWTTWLRTRPCADDVQITLIPRPPSPELLKLRIPLFAALPLQVLAEVLRGMTVHHIPEQAVVVREGAPGSSLFLIQRGAVKVVQHEASGTEVLLATLQEGQVFGERAFLSATPRTATVIALEDTELLELERHTFDAVLGKYPRLAPLLQTWGQTLDAQALQNIPVEEAA